MLESIQNAWQRAKIYARFVFGQSKVHESWGFGNNDEPTPARQRQDYRGLFFRCINIRADQLSSAMGKAKVVRVAGKDKSVEVEPWHPWAQRLKNPMPSTHADDFWRWVGLSRDLLGHAHAIVDDWTPVMGEPIPTGFLPIYSEFGDLNPVPDARGGIKGWRYRRADGKKDFFKPTEVLSIRRSSPYNPYKTMSLIQAAIYELDVDLFMKQFRKDSVSEGGISSPIITTDQPVGEAQRKQMGQEFKKFMGRRGLKEVLALSHGMKPAGIGINPRDLQYIEGNVQNGNDLRFITGIPEALYSRDANQSVLEGAERVMIQYTIQPLVNAVCRQLTSEFERIYGAENGRLRVEPPVLMPIDQALEIKRRESYLNTGQRTRDEYRKKDGKKVYPGGIGNVPTVDFNYQPLRDLVDKNK